MASKFTSGEMVQLLFEIYFGVSDSESSEEEGDGVYAYAGQQHFDSTEISTFSKGVCQHTLMLALVMGGLVLSIRVLSMSMSMMALPMRVLALSMMVLVLLSMIVFQVSDRIMRINVWHKTSIK